MSKKIWFTSDTHYGHRNIIQHSKRPFLNVASMDEYMIQQHNALVAPDDDVYHLGDVALNSNVLPSILERLHGRKHLIRGNHDVKIDKHAKYFEWIKDYHLLRHEGVRMVLFHYPISSWYGRYRGVWHLHGHSHGEHRTSFPKSQSDGIRIDVGVDVWDYRPVSFETIAALGANMARHSAACPAPDMVPVKFE